MVTMISASQTGTTNYHPLIGQTDKPLAYDYVGENQLFCLFATSLQSVESRLHEFDGLDTFHTLIS